MAVVWVCVWVFEWLWGSVVCVWCLCFVGSVGGLWVVGGGCLVVKRVLGAVMRDCSHGVDMML